MTNPGYPIGAVSLLTGIPVDTLRAWERRHAVVEPRRDGRGRVFSEDDVRKLRLLRALVERGHAISRIAGLSIEQLESLSSAVPPIGTRNAVASEAVIAPVLAAIERYDVGTADRELRRIAALLPPRQFVHRAALPLLRSVGEGWSEGRFGVAQEHLAAAVVRDVLGTLARLHQPESPRTRLLFATPSGERHEFGILGAAMLACAGGLGAVYVGPDLPPSEIVRAARATEVRVVVLGILAARASATALKGIGDVAQALPAGVSLWVGGPRGAALESAAERAPAEYLADFEVYEAALERIGARF